MRPLALLVALVFAALGITGLVTPGFLIETGRSVLTPVGIYVIAALRVGIGLVLILAARTSRMPRTLRALGAIILIAGIVTPLFGVDRARGMADWAAAQDFSLIRGAAVGLLGIAGVIAFAVGTGRRATT